MKPAYLCDWSTCTAHATHCVETVYRDESDGGRALCAQHVVTLEEINASSRCESRTIRLTPLADLFRHELVA